MNQDQIVSEGGFAAIPNWVIESDISPQAGWLYVWLKKYADYSTDTAFPSRRTLATKVGLSKAASVDRYVKELVDLGAIEVIARMDPENPKRRLSNTYVVKHTNPVPSTGQGWSPGGDKGGPVEGTVTKNHPIKNHSNSLRSAPSASAEELEMIQDEIPVDTRDLFVEFWAEYPKRADKGAARRAWAKVLKAGVDPAHVVRAAGLYALQVKRDGTETRYIKNPATWLNAESYDDPYMDPADAPVKSAVDSQWDF